MMISHAFDNDNFRIFVAFKLDTIERLIVHTQDYMPDSAVAFPYFNAYDLIYIFTEL